MSSAMPLSSADRDSSLYLRDMVGFAMRFSAMFGRVIEARKLVALTADRMRWDATLRNLELGVTNHSPFTSRPLLPRLTLSSRLTA